MQYAYIIGCGLLLVPWLIIFVRRVDLRKEMIWAGIIGSLLAITDFLYVPEYWRPPTIFNLVNKVGFSIEDLVFGFLGGGLASVIFEFIEQRKLKRQLFNRRYPHYLALIIFALFYVFLEFIYPNKTIYNVSVSMLIGATMMAFYRRDLIQQMIFSGIFFCIIYSFLFVLFNLFFPTFISSFYTLRNFIGLNLWGVPIEEVMFSFAVGVFWSIIYEFTKGYKTKVMHGFFK
ncbi:MAG: lycopene cyclase domain-containing protein [Patescibacteria group bacterium]